MDTQELLDSLHETFKGINERLGKLEEVYCRYQGPRGRDGAPAKVCIGKVEVGDTASVKVRPVITENSVRIWTSTQVSSGTLIANLHDAH